MESQKKTAIDAFGVVVSSLPEDKGVDCSDAKLIKYKVVLDEDAPGNTKVVQDGYTDLKELIQSYRDQCGLTAMRNLIARGVDPATFADDGQHSGDACVPDNLNDAYRASLASAEKRAQMNSKVGLAPDATEEEFNKALDERIKAYIAAQAAKQEMKPNEQK